MLVSARRQTLALIQPLSQPQLNYVPEPGKWSVGEVVDHIVLAHARLLRDIEELIRLTKAGRPPTLARSFAEFNVGPAWLPSFILPLIEIPALLLTPFVPHAIRDVFVRERLIPFRAAPETLPARWKPAGTLHRELIDSLDETQALFESSSNLDFREMVHRHPLLGVNNPLDLLRLSAKHEARHQSQIQDILHRFLSASR